MVKVLSPRALEGLKNYVYKPGGYTWLDHAHTPFWNCEMQSGGHREDQHPAVTRGVLIGPCNLRDPSHLDISDLALSLVWRASQG